MRQKIFFTFLGGLLTLFLSACSKDSGADNGVTGSFLIDLKATTEVIVGDQVVSRAGTGSAAGVEDFSVAVEKQGEVICEWATYAEMQEDEKPELRPSVYTAKAWKGDLSAEGFDQGCYEGKTDFAIKKGEVTPVSILCKLANAKLKIEYTDRFKEYFASYSASVSTGKGNTVEYKQGEERFAYFAPGKLAVNVAVKKAGQAADAVYKVKEIDAQAQHAYTLTLDVDAGSATMTVSFSEKVSQEEQVEFRVTDEALNAPAPYFKAQGFVSGEVFEMLEGNILDKKVYAYINAVGGLTGCTLETNSEFLTEKGFPASVNLAKPGEHAGILKKMGLNVKGFSGNTEQMAMVDFTALLAELPTGSHQFTLKNATDLYGKSSGKETLVLTIKVTACDFAMVTADEDAPFMGQECKVKVQYLTENAGFKGSPDKLLYYIKVGDQKKKFTYKSSETEDGKNFTVTLTAPQEVKFKEAFTLSGESKSYTHEAQVKVGYGIEVAGDYDVWAKKVIFHLYNAEASQVQVEYQKEGDGTWVVLDNVNEVEASKPGIGSRVAVHEVPSNTKFRFRVRMRDGSKDKSNEVEVTTEEEKQVPNSGFEEWYRKELYWTTVFGKRLGTIYGFYPWLESSGESERYWDTTNTLTTPYPGDAATWYYRSFPGVVPTSSSEQTASYHWRKFGGVKDLATEAHTGKNAVEIATIGWGTDLTWVSASNHSNPTNKTPGQLYIGSYNTDTNAASYGKGFTSRPSRVDFWYKYYPYNNETTSPYVIVYDVNGEKIGSGKMTINQRINTFTKGSIDIDYSEPLKKAGNITIVFPSTDVDSPETKDIQGAEGMFVGNYDSRHIGSILTVDDIQLIYE